jgi:hypothetical protein
MTTYMMYTHESSWDFVVINDQSRHLVGNQLGPIGSTVPHYPPAQKLLPSNKGTVPSHRRLWHPYHNHSIRPAHKAVKMDDEQGYFSPTEVSFPISRITEARLLPPSLYPVSWRLVFRSGNNCVSFTSPPHHPRSELLTR